MPRNLPLAGTTAYHRNSNTAALQTIVAPASNTKGIIVLAAAAQFNVASANPIRIMHKATAPATLDDTTAKTILLHAGSLNANGAAQMPYLIPAGDGLYEQTGTSADVSKVSVVYTVLT